jgi:porin
MTRATSGLLTLFVCTSCLGLARGQDAPAPEASEAENPATPTEAGEVEGEADAGEAGEGAAEAGEVEGEADAGEAGEGEAEAGEGEAEAKKSEKKPSFEGPNQVDKQLDEDRDSSSLLDLGFLKQYWEAKEELKTSVRLAVGGDYTATYYAATEWLNEDDAGAGMLRLYGSWDLLGLATDSEEVSGKLAFKVEHRHRYTDPLPPSGFSLDLGHVGLIAPPFSNQEWRLTHLYWRQGLFKERVVIYAGFLDSTDVVDAYILASPWTGFNNLAFSTGSAAIDLPNEAALGGMVGVWITDQFYVHAGLVDANSDPHEPFEDIFNEAEFFKWIEVGWTPSREEMFLTRVHLTFWHKDERDDAGVQRGWGLNGSATVWLADMFLPFLRFGYANDGGGLFDYSVSFGAGFQWEPQGDVVGLAFNWGQPSEDTFFDGVDDQWTGELFYRWKLAKTLEITPSVSTFIDPALNPEDEFIAVFGVRARFIF